MLALSKHLRGLSGDLRSLHPHYPPTNARAQVSSQASACCSGSQPPGGRRGTIAVPLLRRGRRGPRSPRGTQVRQLPRPGRLHSCCPQRVWTDTPGHATQGGVKGSPTSGPGFAAGPSAWSARDWEGGSRHRGLQSPPTLWASGHLWSRSAAPSNRPTSPWSCLLPAHTALSPPCGHHVPSLLWPLLVSVLPLPCSFPSPSARLTCSLYTFSSNVYLFQEALPDCTPVQQSQG